MKNNKGFSLVELIVVIAIMAILAAIAIPTFAHFINKANEASDDELLSNINYIFRAACLENGVDVSEITNAKIQYSENDPIKLTEVEINGVADGDLNDAIIRSFKLHFGDMENEKLKVATRIDFNPELHEFVFPNGSDQQPPSGGGNTPGEGEGGEGGEGEGEGGNGNGGGGVGEDEGGNGNGGGGVDTPVDPSECKHPSYTPSERVEPTCDEAGYAIYTCNGCSHSYREELPAQHDWVFLESDESVDYYECQNCDTLGMKRQDGQQITEIQ